MPAQHYIFETNIQVCNILLHLTNTLHNKFTSKLFTLGLHKPKQTPTPGVSTHAPDFKGYTSIQPCPQVDWSYPHQRSRGNNCRRDPCLRGHESPWKTSVLAFRPRTKSTVFWDTIMCRLLESKKTCTTLLLPQSDVMFIRIQNLCPCIQFKVETSNNSLLRHQYVQIARVEKDMRNSSTCTSPIR